MKVITVLALASVAAGHEQVRLGQDKSGVEKSSWVEHVRHALFEGGVFSDVLDPFTPKAILDVAWTKHKSAKLGNSISPKKLQNPPEYVRLYEPADSTDDPTEDASTYNHNAIIQTSWFNDGAIVRETDANVTCDNLVIALTDADAPSRDDPRWSEVCHWLLYCNNNKAEELVSYKAPGPPEHTGYHRYVLVVMAPANNTIERLDLTAPKSRRRWGAPEGVFRSGVRDWMLQHELEPYGANYIVSKHK